MPVRNTFIGTYQLLLLGGNPVIVERANRDRKMETQAKNLVQGTPKSRIMDIGGVEEDISLVAPILIGGGAAIDGRNILNAAISNAMSPNATLPILTGATVDLAETGGSVTMQLKSDGRPSTQAFTLSSMGADNISGDPLDPEHADGPTRIARFYDFRVNFAGYVYYVISARINVEIELQKKYFLAGKVGGGYSGQLPGSLTDPMDSTDINNPYNFGTQFPFLAVAGIRLSGSGSAAVDLSDNNSDYDYTDSDEATNISLAADKAGYELTYQFPGAARDSGATFALEVYDANSAAWVDLFTALDLSTSLINKADFKVDTGIMTVDFGFTCWVK